MTLAWKGTASMRSAAVVRVDTLPPRTPAAAAPPSLPESWSPGLHTAVRLLLATPEPTAAGCGPGLLAVHNDAFAAIVGADPSPGGAVGRPLRDVCAALWPRLEPLVEGAVWRDESAVLEDQLFCSYRHGYAEETYLRCACAPLVGGGGATAGVIVTLTESTEHVLSVRRTAALREVAAEAAARSSVEDACRRALDAVARHPSDIPFALLYLRDADRDGARLAATAGLVPGTAASPELVALDAASEVMCWPVAAALRTNAPVVVDDLLERFGTLPAGGWPFAPRCAVVMPLTSPGRDAPDGALVAGVSARHELDGQYLGFIELVVKQIAAAVAGGRVHEEEERRAAARAAARLARARRHARVRALKARFAGILEERTRLAREIHDTLLQGVTGIELQLRAVCPHVRTSPERAAEVLDGIIELAEKTSRDARQAVWDMRPAAIGGGGGLAPAVETAARRLTAGTLITIRLSVSGRERRLPAAHETAVLRIAQEAVANAVRHARARTIRLRLAYGTRRLRVAVIDDGRGFTVEEDFRSYAGHWGLLGMQERAAGLGGALVVRSAPGRGTKVALLLPFRRGRSRAAGQPPSE